MYTFLLQTDTPVAPLLVQQPIVTVDIFLALTTQEEEHKYLVQMSPAPPKRAGVPTTTTTTTSTMVQTKSAQSKSYLNIPHNIQLNYDQLSVSDKN